MRIIASFLVIFAMIAHSYGQTIERSKLSCFGVVYPAEYGGVNSSYYLVSNYKDAGHWFISGFQQPESLNIVNAVERNYVFPNIYPNPSADHVTIDCADNQSVSVYLFDIAGKVVRKRQFQRSVTLDLTGINPGVYIVRLVRSHYQLSNQKIIKL